MSEKITTSVNILVFSTVSAVAKTRDFYNSQLVPCLCQVLDREGVVHEGAGNREGDNLDNWAFDPRITICTTNVTRQGSSKTRWFQESKGRLPPSASQPAPGYS